MKSETIRIPGVHYTLKQLAEITEQYGIPYSSVNTVDKAIATLRVYKAIST